MSSYVCSGFSQDLHNNAEKAGIKCAWVGCEFTQGEGHAFNEIQTTDKGIVYIDCTGVPGSCPLVIDQFHKSEYIPHI